MRLDTVTAEIRPRSDWEAVDLGFAMVRRSFWRCIAVWWMVLGIPLGIAGVFLWDQPMLLLLVFWWMKPAGSRMVLFELSRRLFGEEPAWRAVWREMPRAWTRRFFYRFLWARFSPWLPVTLAVEDLEGLRGKPYKLRCGQVVRRGEGVVMWIYFVSDAAAVWLGFGLLGVLMIFMPEGQDVPWQRALESWDPNQPFDIPVLITRTVAACVAVAMSLTDLFVIGAGFGIYINNRTWIEGWDVELAFKQLAQRLGRVTAIVLAFFMVAGSVRAAENPTPAEAITAVKAGEAFKVHTITEKVPIPPKSSSPALPIELIEILLQVLVVCAVAILLGLIGWVIWRYRHVFRMRGSSGRDARVAPSARVVMGMEVSPDTLPGDVPAAAWALWQQERHHDAMALLYRGSISRVMEIGRLEILGSDTEGDCMRRVDLGGTAVHPDYFRGLTGAWVRLAYAGIRPADPEVRALCEQWPFGGGRAS